MRVDDTRSAGVQGTNLARSLESDRGVRRNSGLRSEASDQAARSSSAGLLSLALELGDGESDRKVDSLRQAIQSGTYEIDPNAISRAMLQPNRLLD